MIKKLLQKVIAGVHLSENEAQLVMEEVMEGRATHAQIAALLTALKLKGETVEEITGFARAMRKKATPITSRHSLLVDTCGTGGDGTNTFNISTAAALVLAGAGAKVAKHGNRSVSSRCGSAEVLEALGVNLDLEATELTDCLDQVGIAFLYAPALHGAMKEVAAPRRELGFRTVFNILGPLTNPAGAEAQVVGVYSANLLEPMAEVLQKLGIKRAFIVHGAGGLDEVSPLGPTQVCEIREGHLSAYHLELEDYGIIPASIEELAGGDPMENASIVLGVLEGEQGPRRDAVLLNAALGLMAANLVDTMASGLKVAAQCIDEGLAKLKLQELVDFTSQYGKKGVAAL